MVEKGSVGFCRFFFLSGLFFLCAELGTLDVLFFVSTRTEIDRLNTKDEMRLLLSRSRHSSTATANKTRAEKGFFAIFEKEREKKAQGEKRELGGQSFFAWRVRNVIVMNRSHSSFSPRLSV